MEASMKPLQPYVNLTAAAPSARSAKKNIPAQLQHAKGQKQLGQRTATNVEALV